MTPERVPNGIFLVRIKATTPDDLGDLVKVWGLDVFARTARKLHDGTFAVEGRLSSREIEQLRLRGYAVEVFANADETARERQKELHRQTDEDCDCGG